MLPDSRRESTRLRDPVHYRIRRRGARRQARENRKRRRPQLHSPLQRQPSDPTRWRSAASLPARTTGGRRRRGCDCHAPSWRAAPGHIQDELSGPFFTQKRHFPCCGVALLSWTPVRSHRLPRVALPRPEAAAQRPSNKPRGADGSRIGIGERYAGLTVLFPALQPRSTRLEPSQNGLEMVRVILLAWSNNTNGISRPNKPRDSSPSMQERYRGA